MIISQTILDIFGFRAICYPQVKFFQKVIYTYPHAERTPISSKNQKKSFFWKILDFLNLFESFQDAISVFNL